MIGRVTLRFVLGRSENFLFEDYTLLDTQHPARIRNSMSLIIFLPPLLIFTVNSYSSPQTHMVLTFEGEDKNKILHEKIAFS